MTNKMETKEKTLIERLQEEADFGDLVEVALKDGEFCTRHEPDGIIVFPCNTDPNVEEEFGIKYLCGYYGGITNRRNRGTAGLVGGGIVAVYLDYPDAEKFLCLDPTLHRKDALRELHFSGEGHVKIPVSAIASYKILSTENRGFKVIN